MRIGVVSDTHDNLSNVARIVELFNAARVERVIHTGDITRARTLAPLGRVAARLYGVYGNNDHEREALAGAASRLGFHFVEPPLRLEWAGREITVVHDQHAHTELGDHEVLLHGHDHRRRMERGDGRLIFNPGECAGLMAGRNAVGVLDLIELDVRVLEF